MQPFSQWCCRLLIVVWCRRRTPLAREPPSSPRLRVAFIRSCEFRLISSSSPPGIHPPGKQARTRHADIRPSTNLELPTGVWCSPPTPRHPHLVRTPQSPTTPTPTILSSHESHHPPLPSHPPKQPQHHPATHPSQTRTASQSAQTPPNGRPSVPPCLPEADAR